jgi:hypothetical protein
LDVLNLEEDELLPAIYRKDWEAFRKLLQRPGFSRAWVVQEIAVSQNSWIYCGRDRIRWKRLEIAVNYCTESGLSTAPSEIYFSQALGSARRSFSNGKWTQLLELPQTSKLFRSTDPRDKIIAFLGLADPNELELLALKPDYGLKVQQVYKSATISILKNDKCLDILSQPRTKPDSMVGAPNSMVRDLPSRVPDRSVGDEAGGLSMYELACRQAK